MAIIIFKGGLIIVYLMHQFGKSHVSVCTLWVHDTHLCVQKRPCSTLYLHLPCESWGMNSDWHVSTHWAISLPLPGLISIWKISMSGLETRASDHGSQCDWFWTGVPEDYPPLISSCLLRAPAAEPLSLNVSSALQLQTPKSSLNISSTEDIGLLSYPSHTIR